MTTSIPTSAPDTSTLSTAFAPALSGDTSGTDAAPGSFDQLLNDVPAAGAETPTAPATQPAGPVALQVTLGDGNLFARGQVKILITDDVNPTDATAKVNGPDAEPAAKDPASQRDLIETAAALLAAILPVLPQAVPVPAEPTGGDAALPGGDNAATAPEPSAGHTPAGPVVVVKMDGLPALRLSIPALKTQTDAPLGQTLAEVRELIAAKLAELPGNLDVHVAGTESAAEKDVSPEASVELELELPAVTSLAARPTPVADNNKQDMANFAEAPRAEKSPRVKENITPEKNFLNAKPERVKSDKTDAGIDVAQTATDMAEIFTAHRYTSDQPVFPGAGTVREMMAASMPSQAATSPAESTPVVAVPESALAHRAVETILNVVDAQRSREAEAPVVNLHFKFAGEDLAVRVQLRGGEVHTQFRTDSSELRAALANEWRAVAGQGSESGVRLIEPVFAGSGASGQNGFGSAPHGQFSSQQHAQQQQQQAQGPALLPGLRALRRGAGQVAAIIDPAPRSAVALPTSQHLTAFA